MEDGDIYRKSTQIGLQIWVWFSEMEGCGGDINQSQVQAFQNQNYWNLENAEEALPWSWVWRLFNIR